MTSWAGIELGGTKTIVVRGDTGAIADRIAFATTGPVSTLAEASDILSQWHNEAPLAAIGIASFGPVRVDPTAPDYGTILATPKPQWSNTPVLAMLRARLGVPMAMAIDTDVNAAALAEYRFGAARGSTSIVYITIGTGVGGGVLVNGVPIHGNLHPEIGHWRLRRGMDDSFAGACSFHGDCVEGLISGPALAARFSRHPADVSDDDPAWRPVIADLAELIAALLLAYSPQKIVLGGGVTLKQQHLIGGALAEVPSRLSGYLGDIDINALAAMVVPAALGDDAGPCGALVLAEEAALVAQ